MSTLKVRHLGLIAAMALVVAACGDDDAAVTTTTAPGETTTTAAEVDTCEVGQVDGNLNLYNWSEYIDPDLITAFEAEYGVSVTETFYDSNETMFAQIQAGLVYDLIVPSDYMVEIMISDGRLMELQRDAIPNLANLDPEFADPPFDPGGRFSAGYQWGTTGLAVDMAVVGEDFEETWGLVFDPALASQWSGRISLLNDPRETMGAALKYLGYSLNTTSLDELQEAADLVTAVTQHIAKYDSQLYSDDLLAGETAVAHGYSGTFIDAIDRVDGWDQYYYFVPQEGGTIWIDTIAIPANADHPCTAHAFINFILDAENGAALTNWTYYASPNAAANPFILPEILEDPAIYPDEETMERLEFIEDTGDFEINFTDFFARVRS